MKNKTVKHLLTIAISGGMSMIASAIPSLQLGNGSVGTWSYNTGTQTWVTSSSVFTLEATANATTANGGNGDYAWDAGGAATQTAYLIFAAVPDPGNNGADAFDITVTNGVGTLSLFTSGYGTPPIADTNSLAPHGIYESYFEIYAFNFDDGLTAIANTQPGGTGSGMGYLESFEVTINGMALGVSGIHMDLFTLTTDPTDPKDIVYAFAPFSHDAEYGVPDGGTTVALFGLSLLGLGGARRLSRSRKA